MPEKLKSVIISILLPLCLLGMVSICTSCSSKTDADYTIDYIPVKLDKDSDWSFMSKDGKIKFENEFNRTPSSVINGLFSVKEGEGWSVYGASGDKPQLIKGLEGLSSAGYYNCGLLPVCFPEKRISIVDGEGNEKFDLMPIKGKEIISCSNLFYEDMLRVTAEDGNVGYFNTKGECIIPPIYSKGGEFSEGKAIVLKDSIWMVIDKKGDKLFSFKKGHGPSSTAIIVPRFDRYDRVCMEDNDGRFYMYDGKGEATKLSPKIKKLYGYTDKYIIYSSESDEQGLMSIEGEVLIRPKYSTLFFFEKNTLLASRKDKEWEILDYSGEKKSTLDYSDINYIGGFGCIAGEEGNWTIINNEGAPIDKNNDFFEFYNDGILMPLLPVESCYVPSEKIVKEVSEMITPEGVLGYKLDSPMKDLPHAQKLGKWYLLDNRVYELSVKNLDAGSYSISVEAVSDYYIVRGPYWYEPGDSVTADFISWNPYSDIDLFRFNIHTQSNWGKKGVSEIVKALEGKGYTKSKQEETDTKSAVLVTNGENKIVVGATSSKMIVIMSTIKASTGEVNGWINQIINY